MLDDISPTATLLGRQLVQALDRIKSHPLCLELLAENLLYAGGIERFVQRLFLWAFQTLPNAKFRVEMEAKVDPLKGNESMDLVCFEQTPNFLKITEEIFLNSTQATELAAGIVEMKDNWNRKSISSDLSKMQRIRSHAKQVLGREHEYYEALIIGNNTYDSTFELSKSISTHTTATIDVITSSTGVRSAEQIGRRRLLQNVKNPSDGKAWVSLDILIIRIYFDDNPRLDI